MSDEAVTQNPEPRGAEIIITFQSPLAVVSDKEEKGVMLLPYDAHNHIQLGPTPLQSVIVNNNNSSGNFFQICLSGMAVMSTHPRDFQSVLQLRQQYPTILPCLGVHPWFLHELTPSCTNSS